MTRSNFKSPQTQHGAALLATMFFLVVLTVIGISGMQNNRQEQRISTNIQELNHSFNFAESGLVPGLQSPDLYDTNFLSSVDYSNPEIWLCADPGDESIAVECDEGSNSGNAAVITSYRGKGTLPPVNFSVSNTFATHFFYVSSRGTSNRAVSTHDVGTAVVGPSGVED